MKRPLLLIVAAALCVSCSVLCTKSRLAQTRWTASFDEFVADVGTATTSYTLEFVSAKEYVMASEFIMPSHPATYVNPDGTIDRIPGSTSKNESRGTYRVKSGQVFLTDEAGATHTLHLVSDQLVSNDLSYQPLVFTKEP